MTATGPICKHASFHIHGIAQHYVPLFFARQVCMFPGMCSVRTSKHGAVCPSKLLIFHHILHKHKTPRRTQWIFSSLMHKMSSNIYTATTLVEVYLPVRKTKQCGEPLHSAGKHRSPFAPSRPPNRAYSARAYAQCMCLCASMVQGSSSSSSVSNTFVSWRNGCSRGSHLL